MPLRVFLLMSCLAGCAVLATAAAQSPSAVLAPTGTLRAVFLGLNPVQGRRCPKTGTPSAPAPDVVSALARRIGVPFAIVSAPNAAGIVSALEAREADIG